MTAAGPSRPRSPSLLCAARATQRPLHGALAATRGPRTPEPAVCSPRPRWQGPRAGPTRGVLVPPGGSWGWGCSCPGGGRRAPGEGGGAGRAPQSHVRGLAEGARPAAPLGPGPRAAAPPQRAASSPHVCAPVALLRGGPRGEPSPVPSFDLRLQGRSRGGAPSARFAAEIVTPEPLPRRVPGRQPPRPPPPGAAGPAAGKRSGKGPRQGAGCDPAPA